MKYALINTNNNELIKVQEFDSKPPDIPHKKLKWLSYSINKPYYDPELFRELPPTLDIGIDSVVLNYNAEPLTEQEREQKIKIQIEDEVFRKNPYLGKALLMVYNEILKVQNLPEIDSKKFIKVIMNV